eukprot:13685465-Alexandrium_andersonii.AAC.1
MNSSLPLNVFIFAQLPPRLTQRWAMSFATTRPERLRRAPLSVIQMASTGWYVPHSSASRCAATCSG